MRLSLKACITRFRFVVKQVVDTCMFREDAILFKPAKCATIRLKSIGFTNFVPCLNGVLVPEMRDRDAMLIALVRLRLHLNRNQSKNLIQGCLELIPGRLSLRGAPAWRNGLSTRKVLPNIDMQQIPPKDVRVQVHTDIQDFMLHCPSCGNQKQAANHSLYNKGRWAVFKCSVCVCSRTVRAWQ
jgi:hypothetical protein